MKELQLILVVLLLGAVGYAVYLWRRISSLDGSLRADREASEERRGELEKARKESRERRDELEDVRKQLQESKAKLKRQQKDPPGEGQGKKRQRGQVPQVPDDEEISAAAIVRVGDREIEEGHRIEIDRREQERVRLEGDLKRALDTIDKMKREEERKREDAELAAKALAGSNDVRIVEGATLEEKIAGLTEQLETLQRAAGEEKKRLSNEITKLDVKAKSAHKRATNNHSLYQVVKGQLELAEDKLAMLRMKYEGAKRPEVMRSQDLRVEAEAAAAAAEGPGTSDLPAELTADLAVEDAPAAVEDDAPAAEEEKIDEATA